MTFLAIEHNVTWNSNVTYLKYEAIIIVIYRQILQDENTLNIEHVKLLIIYVTEFIFETKHK